MRAVKKQIEEINRMYESIEKTKSQYLRNDYLKGIRRKKKELKIYCKYRGYDYNEISKSILY